MVANLLFQSSLTGNYTQGGGGVGGMLHDNDHIDGGKLTIKLIPGLIDT